MAHCNRKIQFHKIYTCSHVCLFPDKIPATACVRSASLFNSPDSDDVSHFVHDDPFESADLFHLDDVIDVKRHLPGGADGWACVPPVAHWPRSAKSSPNTVNLIQPRLDQETARRIPRSSPARHVGNNLGPPAQAMESSGLLNTEARRLRATTAVYGDTVARCDESLCVRTRYIKGFSGEQVRDTTSRDATLGERSAPQACGCIGWSLRPVGQHPCHGCYGRQSLRVLGFQPPRATRFITGDYSQYDPWYT